MLLCRQRLIRLHLSPSTEGVAQFLRTSCEGSFCLADLVPQLAETYPNHTLELSLAATRAPAVLFSEKKGGKRACADRALGKVSVFRRHLRESRRRDRRVRFGRNPPQTGGRPRHGSGGRCEAEPPGW